MIGSFNYRLNCSILHFIPQGEVQDGYPVIVFPQKAHDVTIGRTYSFTPVPTRQATYIIDGQTYRVAHAVGLIEHEGTEGSAVDALLYGPAQTAASKLGDQLSGDAAEKLAALRTRLTAQQKQRSL